MGSSVRVGVTRSRCHNPVVGVRLPAMMSCEWSVTRTLVAVKTTVQPESQSWLMERSDDVARAGTMCTRRAARGKAGISKSASCVECMIVPFGLAMLMGLVAGRLLMTCAVTPVQKWEVLPLSAMASASGGMIVGGGTYKGHRTRR